MQFRIVLTAVIYQFLFKRQLNLIQWTSLLILTLGCVIKQVGIIDSSATDAVSKHQSNELVVPLNSNSTRIQEESQKQPLLFIWSTGLILFQMFCSCFAGVYNEYLLKDSTLTKNSDVILQNIFMYADSIVCNLVVFNLSPKSVQFDQSIVTILRNLLTTPLALVLILNNALSGLVASFFLKSLNSILKTFASALELFALTYLAWKIFGDRVDFYTIIALILVSVATVIYSKNPVSIAPPDRAPRIDNRDGFVSVPMNEHD
jgi:drug/metabolite transporter (DMT)-like permease